jgi:ubiquinone/menaquinone biosynthesis C-methylase UbiE
VLHGIDAYVAIADLERSDGVAARRARQAAALAGVRARARLLDAGTGQGWHAIALAERHRVLGTDASEQLIGLARARAARLPAHRRPRFLLAPTERLPLPDARLDAAFSLGTSLGYGTPDEDRAALEELRRVLAPGARLVLEAGSATGMAAQPPVSVRAFGGARVTYAPEVDAASGRVVEAQRLVRADGEEGEYTYALRAYDAGELDTMLRDAGFAGVAIHGALDGRRWRETDPVVAVGRAPV